MLGTKLAAPILGLIAIACAYAGVPVLPWLFFAVTLIVYAVEKIDLSDNERSFAEFCRTHLDNVQLLSAGSATSPSCASPSAASAARD